MRLLDHDAEGANRILGDWYGRGYAWASDVDTQSTRLIRIGEACPAVPVGSDAERHGPESRGALKTGNCKNVVVGSRVVRGRAGRADSEGRS